VVATGAAGDVSTRTTRRAQTPEEAERLARQLVGQVLAAGVGDDRFSDGFDASAPIRVDARVATLAPNLAAAPASDDAAFGADSWASRRRTVYEEAVRFVRDLGGHPATPVAVPVEAVNLGGIGMIAVGGELFLRVGETIRAGIDGGAIVLGYANGYIGYLPDRDAPPSYETVISPVDAGSIDILIDTARAAGVAVGLGRMEHDPR
jgi:hypothetical protein